MMNQNQKVVTGILLFLALVLAVATIAGTFFGVSQLSFLATDWSGFIAIAVVVVIGAGIALSKPHVLQWLLIAVVVVVLIGAVGTFVFSENSENKFLSGVVLFGALLALFGSALQWHKAKMEESSRYQNIVAMNFVVFIVSFFIGAYFNSIYGGVGAFIGIWVIIILLAIGARKAKDGVSKKLHR